MQRGKGMKFVGDSRIPVSKKQNIPKDYSEYPGKTEAFWPNFLLKEWMVGAVFLVGYLVLTVSEPSPLERVADPTDTSYIPLPDWYFLFLYQLLKYKYASGDFTLIGALVIPGVALTALILAPWLDRGPERRPSKRPIAVGMMFLAVISIIYLTWEAVVNHDWEKAAAQGELKEEVEFDPNAEGYLIYSEQSCVGCHGGNLEGSGTAPTLAGTGLSVDEIKDIIVNGKPPGMPPGTFQGSEEELQKLAEFIASLE